MKGGDMDERQRAKITETLVQNEYVKYLGLELLELGQGYAKARMPYSDKLVNPYGSVHGGVLYSFADIVAGTAACTYGNYSSTIDGSMNFVRPAMNTRYVTCEAFEVRQGRQVSVYRAELFNDDGLLMETGTFTFYMMEQTV